jgi:DNA replication protein DnaD
MNGILRSWHESGFKTLSDIEKAEKEFAVGIKESKPEKKAFAKNSSQKYDKPPSYDVEQAVRRSKMVDPKKTKKGQ